MRSFLATIGCLALLAAVFYGGMEAQKFRDREEAAARRAAEEQAQRQEKARRATEASTQQRSEYVALTMDIANALVNTNDSTAARRAGNIEARVNTLYITREDPKEILNAAQDALAEFYRHIASIPERAEEAQGIVNAARAFSERRDAANALTKEFETTP